jgi:hypothetical protein
MEVNKKAIFFNYWCPTKIHLGERGNAIKIRPLPVPLTERD